MMLNFFYYFLFEIFYFSLLISRRRKRKRKENYFLIFSPYFSLQCSLCIKGIDFLREGVCRRFIYKILIKLKSLVFIVFGTNY